VRATPTSNVCRKCSGKWGWREGRACRSAHLDDAVLSCGQFLAGRPEVTVATVFAGTPSTKSVLTAYDAKAGFTSAAEAMEARRSEDREAMSVLQARAVHLDFVDSQYGGKLKLSALVKELEELIDELDPEFVVGPLGLVHSDHETVRDAVLEASREATRPVWLYEDLPYRVAAPEAVPAALDDLRGRGYELELGFIGTGPIDKKMDALLCYRSQRGLPEFPTGMSCSSLSGFGRSVRR
jgi:LmbE family N-acetylglucosaminyl deacetylase